MNNPFVQPAPVEQRHWLKDALCVDDVELFEKADKAIRKSNRDQSPVHEALAMCRFCPARKPCLEDAIENEQGAGVSGRFSIRGGMTPNDRYEAWLNRNRPKSCA